MIPMGPESASAFDQIATRNIKDLPCRMARNPHADSHYITSYSRGIGSSWALPRRYFPSQAPNRRLTGLPHFPRQNTQRQDGSLGSTD